MKSLALRFRHFRTREVRANNTSILHGEALHQVNGSAKALHIARKLIAKVGAYPLNHETFDAFAISSSENFTFPHTREKQTSTVYSEHQTISRALDKIVKRFHMTLEKSIRFVTRLRTSNGAKASFASRLCSAGRKTFYAKQIRRAKQKKT
jgi:hypothetical protein